MLHHICPLDLQLIQKFLSKPLSLSPVNQTSVCHTNSSPVDSFGQTVMRL